MNQKVTRETVSKIKSAKLRSDFQDALNVRDLMQVRYTKGTRTLYLLDVDIYLEWCFDNQKLPLSTNRTNFEMFGQYLIDDRKNSPRSACRRMTTIRTFFRLAMSEMLIGRDPTFMAKFPKWSIDPNSIPSMSQSEVRRLLRSAEETSKNHHVSMALMAMLGLRISEVCSIRVEDFHTDAIGYTILTANRKGGTVEDIPLPLPLLMLVRDLIEDRKSGPLIRTRNGNPQNRRGLYDWFKRVAKKAGLSEKIHPHTLRHAAITALIESGEPLHRVQSFAGHRDIRTTEHYYRRRILPDQHGGHITARLFSYEP